MSPGVFDTGKFIITFVSETPRNIFPEIKILQHSSNFHKCTEEDYHFLLFQAVISIRKRRRKNEKKGKERKKATSEAVKEDHL